MGTLSVEKFYIRGCLLKSRNENSIVAKFVGQLNGQKYVLLRVFSTHGCGWLWPELLPFEMMRATMMDGGPPSICANIAVVNDEAASASHRYGYLENGASSSSARRTI